MRKLLMTLLCASVCSYTYAQVGSPNGTGFIFDLGINDLAIKDVTLNTWAKHNYNLNANPGMGGVFDIAVAGGKWDADLHFSLTSPVVSAGIEFGKRLTGAHSPIASYINLDWGDFNLGFNKLALTDYKLTPDQQGQEMQLQSDNTYFGITSRNYLPRFYLGKKRKTAIISGFYITEGWMPLGKRWEYGYYENDGTDADGDPSYSFVGKRVHGIPYISNFFIDAGAFVGIAFF